MNDRTLLARLRREVRAAFDDCIGSPRSVAFLMYPYDGNVGNHMMWLALVDHLHERGIRIAYAAHHMNFHVEHLRRAIGTDPILFSGGVSLTRLWPEHPDTKRVVAREFPHNRIVSLTSTIYFVDEADERSAATMFGAHDDVVVMARDPPSAQHAAAILPRSVQIVTAPDSAFGLPLQQRSRPPHTPVAWLQRDDAESTRAPVSEQVSTFDWSNDLRRSYPRAYLALRLGGVFSRIRSSRYGRRFDVITNRVVVWSYIRASREVLAVGNRALDVADVLVTDRMHPHVLAALRGQPVVLLPDRYGKNRAVHEFNTHQLDSVYWADGPAEAESIARRLATDRTASTGSELT